MFSRSKQKKEQNIKKYCRLQFIKINYSNLVRKGNFAVSVILTSWFRPVPHNLTPPKKAQGKGTVVKETLMQKIDNMK